MVLTLMRSLWAAALFTFWLPAWAFIPPPMPLELRFEPGSAALSRVARLQVDRLAVRVAMCEPKGDLRVSLIYRLGTPSALPQRRLEAVRQRLALLQLAPRLVLEANTDTNSQWVGRDSMLASAQGGGSEYCEYLEGAGLQAWVQELRDGLGQSPVAVPSFWRHMNEQVLRGDLALPLAQASYCGADPGCDPPSLYWWLVDKLGMQQGLEGRQRWLQRLWEHGSEADFLRLQTAFGLEGLPLPLKAESLAHLLEGELPWSLIAARGADPAVLAAARGACPRGSDVCGYSGEEGLLRRARDRGEWQAYGRLVSGTVGPQRDCYVAAVLEEGIRMRLTDVQAMLPHLRAWFGVTLVAPDPRTPPSCDARFRAWMLASGCWVHRVGMWDERGDFREPTRNEVTERLQLLMDAGLPLPSADIEAASLTDVSKSHCDALSDAFYQRRLRPSRIARVGGAGQ